LLIRAKNIPALKSDTPVHVEPLGGEGTVEILIEKQSARYVGFGPEGDHWAQSFTVRGLTPGKKIGRHLSITIPDVGTFFHGYTITLPTRTPPVWNISAPPKEWRPESTPQIGFSIGVGEVSLSDLKVVQSTLVRSDEGAQIVADDLVLCIGPCRDNSSLADTISHPPDDPAIGSTPDSSVDHREHNDASATGVSQLVLPPNDMTSVYLRLKHNDLVGEFSGNVYISARDAGTPKPIELHIARQAKFGWLFGLFCILAGVGLAWVTNNYLHCRVSRLRALLPAGRLRDVLIKLEKQRCGVEKNTGALLTKIKVTIDKLTEELRDSSLDSHSFLPRISKPNPSASKIKEFQDYLNRKSAQVDIISLVMDKAIVPMCKAWDYIDSKHSDTVTGLLDRAAALCTQDDRAKLTQALDEIDKEFQKIPRIPSPQRGRPPVFPPAEPGSETMQVEIAQLHTAVTLLWMSLTLLAGWMVWIHSNPGFGLPIDYVKCFLWGIGLPVIGNQVQQLTPSSIGSVFNISVPTSRK
jgi:hypothetical protein